jgi:ketosteroid isomerase-like protein
MGHNADLLRRSLAALDARDEAGFRALIAPDGEMTSPQGTFRGPGRDRRVLPPGARLLLQEREHHHHRAGG